MSDTHPPQPPSGDWPGRSDDPAPANGPQQPPPRNDESTTVLPGSGAPPSAPSSSPPSSSPPAGQSSAQPTTAYPAQGSPWGQPGGTGGPPSPPQPPPYGSSNPYGQPTQVQPGAGQPTQLQPPYQQPGYGGQQQPYGQQQAGQQHPGAPQHPGAQQPAYGRATPPGQGPPQPPYSPYGAPGTQPPGDQPGHAYGGYPGTAGYGAPPAAPKKRRTGLFVGLGVVGVILLALCVGGIFWSASAVNNANLEAGQCVRQESDGGDDKAVKVSCSAPDAYRILDRRNGTTKADGCPDKTTHTFVNTNDEYVLCLRKAS